VIRWLTADSLLECSHFTESKEKVTCDPRAAHPEQPDLSCFDITLTVHVL
jgi:hypothetical protein